MFFFCGAVLVQPCGAIPLGGWKYTDDLKYARWNHTSTLLADGRVLVAAGVGGSGTLVAAGVYDPGTQSWTRTGSLNIGRYDHTATLLLNGQVLVAGGTVIGGQTATAELYDPATGNWTLTGSLNTARIGHTATLLSDGRVLIAGGFVSGPGWLASAELYDPATGAWISTGSLNTRRVDYTATLLSDGQVLVAGGFENFNYLKSAELYNPATGTWTVTSSLNTARAAHTATLLANGEVLVTGGSTSSAELAETEIYHPTTANWTSTGSLNLARTTHTATLLPDGTVLVAGGRRASGGAIEPTASAEIYEPATGNWSETGSLNTARFGHTDTLLLNGKVLVAAGVDTRDRGLASAELYDPGLVAATKVYGSGTVDNQGNEVTFRFRASQGSVGTKLGGFEFCDQAAAVCIAKAGIDGLFISGNTAADFRGSGRLEDGTRVRFKVSVTNNGSPGTSDTLSITFDNGYSVNEPLTSGDIRIY